MDTSRRSFFRTVPVFVALPASWTAFTKALRAAPSASDANNEMYWSLVKRQFPLEENLVYLNAANVCPASRPVLDRHAQFMRDFQSNPSFQNRAKYDTMREARRDQIAAIFPHPPPHSPITRPPTHTSN